MKVELGRLIGLCLAGSVAAMLGASCATGGEDDFGRFNLSDAGTDTSAGAAGYGGAVGQGGVSFGGAGGVQGQGGVFGQGGVVGQGGVGGTDGSGGSGGDTGGTDGASGTTGTGGAPQTCNPAFCPNNGMGMPCCTDPPDSHCGMNNGSGCQRTD